MSGSILVGSAKTLPIQRLFFGYCTVNFEITGTQHLYDIDLVNRDLYYAFNTRIGERIMRPDFGCRIWDYFMEPLTTVSREAIVTEAIRICNTDSRVSVINVTVDQLDSGVRVTIDLRYDPYDVINTFAVDFEGAEAAALNGPTQ